MIAKTQTIEGATSLQKDGTHIPMWDLEGRTLGEITVTTEIYPKQI